MSLALLPARLSSSTFQLWPIVVVCVEAEMMTPRAPDRKPMCRASGLAAQWTDAESRTCEQTPRHVASDSIGRPGGM